MNYDNEMTERERDGHAAMIAMREPSRGVRRQPTPSPTLKDQVCALHTRLDARAEWLRKEWQNGGDYAHLSAREEECRYIKEMLGVILAKGTTEL